MGVWVLLSGSVFVSLNHGLWQQSLTQEETDQDSGFPLAPTGMRVGCGRRCAQGTSGGSCSLLHRPSPS